MSSYAAQLVEATAREVAKIVGGAVERDVVPSWERVRWPVPAETGVLNVIHIGPHEAFAHVYGLTHQQAIELAELVRAWRVADAIEPRRPDVLTRSLCEATGCKRQLSFLPVTDMLQTTVYHGEHRHVFEWPEYEDSRAVHEAINAWVASHHQEDQS